MFGKKKRRKRRTYRQDEDLEEGLYLSPETKGAIFTVIIFVIAFISILSIFVLVVGLGHWLNSALSSIFLVVSSR